MKILFICENYFPFYGGAETLFKNLAEGFSKKEHRVSVLTRLLPDTTKRETIDQVDIHRVPSINSRYIFTFSSLFKAIRLAKKHDIIQTTTFNSAFPAWLAGKLAGKPVVLTVHEVWVGKWKEVTGFSWFKSAVHDVLERMLYLFPFDQYVCVSEYTRKDLLKIGIKPEKAKVIYNGLDYSFWNPRKVKRSEIDDIRDRLGLKDKYVFFSWGRPGNSKGFEYAIRAFPQVAAEKKDAMLLLVLSSASSYKKKYQELIGSADSINRLIGSEKIKVIPSLSREELRTLLAAVDCAVVPSLAEGFGFSAAEASAMGKDIIASDAGSLPEVVSGRSLFFRNRDCLDLAEKMIEAGNDRYGRSENKNFRWDSCIKGYADVYGPLMKINKKSL